MRRPPPLVLKVDCAQKIRALIPGVLPIAEVPLLSIDEGLAFGSGGNASVYKGTFGAVANRNPVIVKVTGITEANEIPARLQEREEVFRRLGKLRIDGILKPKYRYVQAFTEQRSQVFAEQRGQVYGDYLEIYPFCLPYVIPRSQEVYINHIRTIIMTLVQLHEIGIAHMDFKRSNIMLRQRGVDKFVPVLIDLGEARFFPKANDESALPISTTTDLFIRSPTMKSLIVPIAGEEFLSNAAVGFAGIMCLFTPPSLYSLIDQIMMGIFLADSEVAAHTPEFNRRKKMIGTKLIRSALYTLFTCWYANHHTQIRSLFTYKCIV